MRDAIIGIVLFLIIAFAISKRNKKEYVSFSESQSNIKFYKKKWYWGINMNLVRVIAYAALICVVAIIMVGGGFYLLQTIY